MGKKKPLEPPKSGKGDAAHALVRAGISSIPVVGAAASELLTLIVTPPLERQRIEWMEDVGEGLRELEEKHGINLEELRDNPVFIDTVMHASQAAIRNSQEEKHRALRNAILNAALPNAPEQALQQMFVNFIDTFTEWHLRILNLFDDPSHWFQLSGQQPPRIYVGGLSTILENAYPELRNRRSFNDLIWCDLYTRGLVNTEGLHDTMAEYELTKRRTSEMGQQFLEFIEEPS